MFLYSISIRIASIWNPKAKRWLEGRRNNIDEIASQMKNVNAEIVWFHCASMGEFEQGIPLMEELKKTNSQIKIVLTFFSPSGYDSVKEFKAADYKFYLPMDSYFAAKKFIDQVNPKLVIWIKYEFWYYYLAELKKRKIPVLLVSGVFRKSQPFFKWYGKVWRNMLDCFTFIFVQNQESKKLLETIGVAPNVTIAGDTRFDRVIEVANLQFEFPIIEVFCKNHNTIVAGSTWEDDEIILASYTDETNHREKLILVPHELDHAHLNSVSKIFKKSIFYSEVQNKPGLINNLDDYNTLIIDTVGMLSRLYSYGYVNYVGGGFTADGIHNVLEAAVWSKPIIFGENYVKYSEAVDLVECLAAESISNTNELMEIMNILSKDNTSYQEAAIAGSNYVRANVGATKKITDYIYVNRLLTS